MARSGKCRVLVSGGVAVAAEPAPKVSGLGTRVAVGEPKWSEIVKSPVLDLEPTPEDNGEFSDPLDIPVEDPRDVPLWRPAAYLCWALDNYPWRPDQRKILGALIAAQGDVESVRRSLKLEEGIVIKMLNRAKSEVVMAAKWLDYQDEFKRDRRPAPNVKQIPNQRFFERQLWFSGEPDLLAYLFDLDRRRCP